MRPTAGFSRFGCRQREQLDRRGNGGHHANAHALGRSLGFRIRLAKHENRAALRVGDDVDAVLGKVIDQKVEIKCVGGLAAGSRGGCWGGMTSQCSLGLEDINDPEDYGRLAPYTRSSSVRLTAS
jgi:hypothetical protein